MKEKEGLRDEESRMDEREEGKKGRRGRVEEKYPKGKKWWTR